VSVRTQVAVDTQMMRGINTSAVLAVLRTAARMSVSELSERTGLSRQAVTRSLATLDGAGLIDVVPPDLAEQRSGRPAQLVRFRAEAGNLLGISVTPRDVRVAIADLAGEIRVDVATLVDPAHAVESVLAGLRTAIEQSGITRAGIWAATVGSPGVIDPESGLVRFLPSMSDLQGDALVRELERELACPVLLDNDLNLATEGELWRGTHQGLSSMVLIEWGERVGAGLVLNGALYRGSSNDAGDVGFLPLLGADGAVARTAGLGPFESWVGIGELVAHARRCAAEAGDSELAASLTADTASSFEVVLGSAQAGNASSREAIAHVARRFAAGLMTVRALLDPQVVVIGGPMARAGQILLDALTDALSGEVLDLPIFELSTLGDDAIVCGAVHRCLAYIEDARFASHSVTETVTPKARQNR
jgi:predicted NBD/HSP70 family sugar kinase